MGPGYFSQLILCENALPMDMVYHKHSYNIFNQPFQGEQFVAFLDNDINRRLFAHQMSNDTIIEGLEVGISEAVIAHQHVNKGYYLPLPFWPYYLSKKIQGIGVEEDRYADHYIGIDLTYHFNNDVLVYGQVLVDEFPMSSIYNNPKKVANLIGAEYPIDNIYTLRSEFSNVFSYVYVHRYVENNYVYKGRPIGHWLGSDGDVFDIHYYDKRALYYWARLYTGQLEKPD